MGVRMKIGTVCWWIGIIFFEIMITTQQVLTGGAGLWLESCAGNKSYDNPLWALFRLEMIMITFFVVIYLSMLWISSQAKRASQASRFANLERLHTAAGIVAAAAGIIVGLRSIF